VTGPDASRSSWLDDSSADIGSESDPNGLPLDERRWVERPMADLFGDDARAVARIATLISGPESALGPQERAEVLAGFVLGCQRGRSNPPGDLDVVGILADDALMPDTASRINTTLGALVEALGPTGGGPLIELLVSHDVTLDSASRAAYLLGVAAQRLGWIRDSAISAVNGPGWPLLGHLFDPALGVDVGTRALFLLGAVAERMAHMPDDVLSLFEDTRWAMSLADKAVLLLVAAALRPGVAIDAGTFLGGSATALSRFAERVVTIDMDEASGSSVAGLPNVEFRCGAAADVLRTLLPTERSAELVVLDASHTTDGIMDEVQQLLDFPPDRLRAVLIHDSAMETCRAGLEAVDWEANPAVRGVTLDFLPGEVRSDGVRVGGLAVVWLLADEGDARAAG
jgi:hypothetical protein